MIKGGVFPAQGEPYRGCPLQFSSILTLTNRLRAIRLSISLLTKQVPGHPKLLFHLAANYSFYILFSGSVICQISPQT